MALHYKIVSALASAACLLALPAGSAVAGTLQMSPILVQFYTSTQAQPIWLTNKGDAPLRAQVRIYKWTQTEDDEHLEITNDIVASPPVMELEAGQRQLLRIVRRNLSPVAQEESFRVIVDELPSPGAAPSSDTNTLSFLLRYSIPAFISPAASPEKTFHHQAHGNVFLDKPRIQLTNKGASRIRVSQLIHEDAHGNMTTVVDGLMGYVLVNQKKTWPIPSSAAALPPGTFKIKMANDAGETTLQLDMADK